MKDLIAFVIGMAFGAGIICGGFWVNGFDFDERGDTAGWCYIVSVIVGLISGGVFAATFGTPVKDNEAGRSDV